MKDMRPFCRRCHLEALGTDPDIRNMQDFIAAIEPEKRVCEAAYRTRLESCARCPSLMRGVCRLCGCFVELRAALAVQSCPDIPPRWQAEPAGAAQADPKT